MNKLAREGLFPEEAFIWTSEVHEQWVAGNVIVVATNECPPGATTPIGETGTTRHVLPPWDTYAYSKWEQPWMADLFPTASDKSDRAIRFVQYYASPEGYVDTTAGVEGEAWTGDIANGPHFSYNPDNYVTSVFPNGMPTWFPEFLELAQADYANVIAAGLHLPPIIALDGIKLGAPRWQNGPDPKAIDFVERMKPYYTSGAELYVPIRGDSDVGIIREQVDKLFEDYFARMVFAETEEEAVSMIAEFQEKAGQAGLAQFEAEATSIYRANLGM